MNTGDIKRAIGIIESRYDQNLSVKAISQELNLSYHHFIHEFSRHQRIPVWQYIRKTRLENAFGLIAYSSYSLSSIAELCGFSTKHAFSKAFHQHFQFSPSHLRKQKKITLQGSFGHLSQFTTTTSVTALATREINVQPFIFYYKYYEALPHIQHDLHGFQQSADNAFFLQHRERFDMISHTVKANYVLHEALLLADILQKQLMQNSCIVLPVSKLGQNMIRAGFWLQPHEHEHQQLLQRLHYQQMPAKGGKFLVCPVDLPVSFAATAAFHLQEEITHEGYYTMRENIIHMGTTDLLQPHFTLYIPIA